MGGRLAAGNVAIALLANTIATGAALVALILAFGPISGAHFNPAVTLAEASQSGLPRREVPVYITAQIGGAFVGVAAAHLMFGEPLFVASRHVRAGNSQIFAESVATFGLISVIWGCVRSRSSAGPVRRRRQYYRRLLVHVLHIFCQSCRDAGPSCIGHLRGHSSERCSGVHLRTTGRCHGSDVAIWLAAACP
jgi:glycerol uptake facilitator-like aquaporin